jgi:CBS domain containing-hemolysin-like protein
VHPLIDPPIRIDEFVEAVGAQIPPGDYTTLSGFIYQASRTHSGAKDRIVLPECVLTVDQLDGPRIVRISCTLTKHPNALTAASS